MKRRSDDSRGASGDLPRADDRSNRHLANEITRLKTEITYLKAEICDLKSQLDELGNSRQFLHTENGNLSARITSIYQGIYRDETEAEIILNGAAMYLAKSAKTYLMTYKASLEDSSMYMDSTYEKEWSLF